MDCVGADALQSVTASRKNYDVEVRCMSGVRDRYYDPTTGRYITSDPIGLGGGLNTYGYVGGNPLVKYDLKGLSSTLTFPTSGTTRPWTLPGLGVPNPILICIALFTHSSAAGEGSDVNPCYDGPDPDPSQCEPDDCDMKFVREVYYGGETKTCMYHEKKGMFTFPQDKELPCMPVDKERCLVDTSLMGPKARKASGK